VIINTMPVLIQIYILLIFTNIAIYKTLLIQPLIQITPFQGITMF